MFTVHLSQSVSGARISPREWRREMMEEGGAAGLKVAEKVYKVTDGGFSDESFRQVFRSHRGLADERNGAVRV